MRMVVVVVLEPSWKLRQNRLCIRAIVNVKIISPERFDERLRHPIRPRRPDRREARDEANRLSERDRLVNTVATAVIREPLDRVRGLLPAETPLDNLEHEISDHPAGDTTGSATYDMTLRSQVASAIATRPL